MDRPFHYEDLTYYRALARSSPELSPEREASLARRLRGGDRQAAEELARSAQRHVLSLALKYRRYRVPLTELVAEGNLGLVRALAKFDADRGVRFVTYASYWVRAQMLGCVVRARSLVGGSDGPMRSQLFFKLRRERARVFAQLGEGEQAQIELARRLHVSVERAAKLIQRLEAHDVSLDEPLSQLAGEEDQERALQQRRSEERLHSVLSLALQGLDPRERRIVEQRSMAGREEALSLAELARSLGISRERARQLEARAFAKLRNCVVERDPELVDDLLGAA